MAIPLEAACYEQGITETKILKAVDMKAESVALVRAVNKLTEHLESSTDGDYTELLQLLRKTRRCGYEDALLSIREWAEVREIELPKGADTAADLLNSLANRWNAGDGNSKPAVHTPGAKY